MLKGGEIGLTGVLPDLNRSRIGLLKHAYLAGCLRYGIPEGEHADQVRADLIAARDAPRRLDVPPSALANGLTVLRFYGPAVSLPPVVHAVADLAVGDAVDGALLGGRVFVSWSSTLGPDPHAFATRRISVPLSIGEPLSGVVSAVGY
jgi:hypothetical protein